MRALVLGLLVSILPTSSQADSLLDHVRGDPVLGPIGWQRWCLADLEDCLPQGVSVVPDRETARLLALAKDSVDARLTRRADAAGDDLWSEDASYGDCEDFALAYRRELLRLGVPRGALRLVVADTEHGARHVVLSVETYGDAQILDVRQARPVSWRALDYTWIGVEDSHLPLWRLLKPSRPGHTSRAKPSGGSGTPVFRRACLAGVVEKFRQGLCGAYLAGLGRLAQ